MYVCNLKQYEGKTLNISSSTIIALTMKVKSLPKFKMKEFDILYHSNASHSISMLIIHSTGTFMYLTMQKPS